MEASRVHPFRPDDAEEPMALARELAAALAGRPARCACGAPHVAPGGARPDAALEVWTLALGAGDLDPA